MPGHLKLDRLLSDADRARLNQLAVRPGTRTQDAFKWVRERGYDVGRHAVYSYLCRHRPDRPKKLRFSKLDKILKPEDRPLVEAMCSDPGTTGEGLHRFLKSKGYEISRIACARHLSVWRHELLDIRRSARFARALAQVAKDVGPSAFGGGAMLGFEQVVMEHVFDLRHREKVGPRDLTDWAAMLERAIGVREQLETFRRKSERAREKAAGDKGGASERPRPDGRPHVVNGVEIANCVRRILGVPLPDDPFPQGPVLPLLPPAPPALPHVSGGGLTTESTEGTEDTEKNELR